MGSAYSGMNVKTKYIKGKAIPLQAWIGPEDSRMSAHEDGKVVSPTHRPPFLLEAESTPEP